MKLTLLQLFLITCVCENIEDTILKLDSYIFQAVSVPKITVIDGLRDNISDLYMAIDEVYEKVQKDDVESRVVVKSIIGRGGLTVLNLVRNTTMMIQGYNLSVQAVQEIQESIGGVCYMWRKLKEKVDPSVVTTMKTQ